MQGTAFIIPGHDLDSMKEQKDETGQPDDGKEKIIGGPAYISGNEVEEEQTASCPGQGKEDKANQGMAPQAVEDDKTGQGADAVDAVKHELPPS